jgi:hypothetical protein
MEVHSGGASVTLYLSPQLPDVVVWDGANLSVIVSRLLGATLRFAATGKKGPGGTVTHNTIVVVARPLSNKLAAVEVIDL